VPMNRPRRIGSAVALMGLAMLVNGCTLSAPPATSLCLPRFAIEPSEVRPGDSIMLVSDTPCDVDPPEGGWAVLAAPSGMPDLGVRATTTEDFDGSFRVQLELPDDFPPGDAFAGIDNWDYSACSDGGSCASASVDFVVLPDS